MNPNKITFSLNMHDKYGDVWQKCINLHIEPTGVILQLENAAALEGLIKNLQKVRKEIKETYNV